MRFGSVFQKPVTYDVANLELNEMCTLLDELKDRQMQEAVATPI